MGRPRSILRLAALLHDLGHPPFSHSGEHLLPTWKEAAVILGKPPPGRDQFHVDHEDMTAHLIRNSEIGELIEKHYRSLGISVDDVIAVAVKPGAVGSGRKPDPLLWLLHEVLTWDFGTDRMDFLLRDAHHSGQPTGQFDHRKFLDSLVLIDATEKIVADPDRGGIRVGIDGAGWLVAEQMVVARYLMYVSLYFHKTKRVYEQHMQRFLPSWLQASFKRDNFPVDVAAYIGLGESAVMAEVARAARDPKHPGHADAKPFIDRSHFRLSKELVLSDNAAEVEVSLRLKDGTEQVFTASRHPDKRRLEQLQKHLQGAFGSEVMIDTADHSATKLFSPGGQVLVLLDGKPRYLGELSEIVRGMPTRVWRCRVYAAHARRATVKEACERWLSENPSERIRIDAQQPG